MEQIASGAFEFSAMQNDTIRILARRMKFVGIFYIVIGVLIGLAALLTLFMTPLLGVGYGLAAGFEIIIGIWTTNAASSFRMIVETTGNDIAHLNHALESLRKLYNLQFWLLAIIIVLFGIGLISGGLLMVSEIGNGVY